MNIRPLHLLLIKKNQQLHACAAIISGCLAMDPVMANSCIRRILCSVPARILLTYFTYFRRTLLPSASSGYIIGRLSFTQLFTSVIGSSHGMLACFLSSAISVVIRFLAISSITRSCISEHFVWPQFPCPSTAICNVVVVALHLNHRCPCPNDIGPFSLQNAATCLAFTLVL